MATETPVLKARSRAASGTTQARRLRREGLLPAVAYGKALPSTPIAVEPTDIATILRSDRGKNTVLELELEGSKHLAMIRDYSLHPVNRELLHVDFVEVKLDRPVEVDVPLFAIGKPVGVTKGGVLRIVHRNVPVRCLPDRIPSKLEADVTHLELGQHVSTQELNLPEGVIVRLPATQTLIAVVAPEKEEVEEVAPTAVGAPAVPGAAGAAEAGAAPAGAPAAGAPAAEAAPPAKEERKKK